MAWSLYEKENFLEPLKFSNGKTQEDVVKEVVDSIKAGEKIIFIHGKCGTGKSAIALNIARELGKSSIVVPSKALQQQYKRDYEENKYILNSKKKKLNISVITGRNNHKCKFLEDNKNAIPQQKQEVDSKLYDIFEGRREKLKELLAKDLSADNKNIPCKIEIKEKNMQRLKEYLKQNKKINPKNFDKISDIKRMSIAPVCPYWSPVVPEEYDVKNLSEIDKIKYRGLQGKNFNFYRRKPGCGFYEQFNSYIDSDIIVFNALKYKLESALNRKPCTEVEIIDECDEFLDSFSNQRNINIDRLQNSLLHAVIHDEENFQTIHEINEIINHLKKNSKVNELIRSREIVELKKTGLYDLFKIFLKNSEFMNEIDEESYVYDVEGTVKMFDEFLDETYVIFDKKEDNLIASIVTINLAKKFREMMNKNKIIILMSGTLHSPEVLSDIFGIEKFKIIEAETENPGKIKILRIGDEMDCKYSNFSSGKAERKKYLEVLDKCIEVAKKPILIHVNSYGDLPDKFERDKFELKHVITREDLMEIQNKDKEGEIIKKFKDGRINILFSTKCSRGVDFPGDECRSIIFTKFPNPNVQDAFWKILNRTNPQKYWSFYKDKARREVLQKVYRGVRFKEDEVTLMSPDSRVLDFFEKKHEEVFK
jgi:Rad3-related DNA helicase